MALPNYLEEALPGKTNFAKFVHTFLKKAKGNTKSQWNRLFNSSNEPIEADSFEHDTIVLALNEHKKDAQRQKTVATKILHAMILDLQAGTANTSFENAMLAAKVALQSIIDEKHEKGVQLQNQLPFVLADMQL